MTTVDTLRYWGGLALLCAPFLLALYISIFNIYVFTLEIVHLRREIRCLKEGKPYSRPHIPSAVIAAPTLIYIAFALLTFTFSHSPQRNSELYTMLATLGAVFAVIDVLTSVLFIIAIRRLVEARDRLFASKVSDPFFEHLLHHRFEQAHSYLSPTARSCYSLVILEQEWRQLEETIGVVSRWGIFSLGIWKEAGDIVAHLVYRVQGSRGQAEIRLRLRAQENHWQIEELTFRPKA
ncbi:MAG: hypothetical protein SNJ72_09470 [Fimbriimonadales bacterium]